jgi:hypothetical protein
VRGPTYGLFTEGEGLWSQWLRPSGVESPSVLAVDLEGRFPTPAALVDLVLPLANATSGGSFGQLALIFCTSDEATKTLLRALADAHGVSFFIADSVDAIREAEPAGPLTPAETETLERLRDLGGRTTVSVFATDASLEPSAANNRLMALHEKGLLPWEERSRREGNLFLDPRYAVSEEPADPTAPDYGLPEEVRSDLRALAEMQGRDPNSLYAEAVKDFVDRHSEHLSREHAEMQKAIADDDDEAIKAVARRYARKQAQARRRAKSGAARPRKKSTK